MPGRSGSARASRSLVQRPWLGPAAELAGDGVGLAEALGEGGPGRGRAAGQGVGGEPEDGVEAGAGVADGAAGGAAVAEGWRVGVLGGLDGGLAPRLHLGFGGAEDEGGEDGPLGVGERFPGPFGGVAAVVAEADHGGGRPSREALEHNMNER